MSVEGQTSAPAAGGNFRDRLELWSAALLAAATLTTAYSAHSQGNRRGAKPDL